MLSRTTKNFYTLEIYSADRLTGCAPNLYHLTFVFVLPSSLFFTANYRVPWVIWQDQRMLMSRGCRDLQAEQVPGRMFMIIEPVLSAWSMLCCFYPIPLSLSFQVPLILAWYSWSYNFRLAAPQPNKCIHLAQIHEPK